MGWSKLQTNFSLSPITKKIQKKEGFYFYLFVVFFFAFFDVF